MSIYSTLFFSGIPATNSLATAYTVPATQVAIVRDIETFCPLANDVMYVQMRRSGVLSIIWLPTSVATGIWRQWAGRTVIPSGCDICIYSQLGSAQFTISGYLLSP